MSLRHLNLILIDNWLSVMLGLKLNNTYISKFPSSFSNHSIPIFLIHSSSLNYSSNKSPIFSVKYPLLLSLQMTYLRPWFVTRPFTNASLIYTVSLALCIKLLLHVSFNIHLQVSFQPLFQHTSTWINSLPA